MNDSVFVATIDGPAGVGKGTLAKRLASKFNYLYLDSGAVYRAVASRVIKNKIDTNDITAVAHTAKGLALDFPAEKNYQAHVNGENIDADLRLESCSNIASKIASIPEVRAEVLDLQRSFQNAPGLIADGRDLGSVVFPRAQAKIFLDASCEERAQRRYKQLINQGISASFDHLFDSIRARDERDRTRSTSPLVAAKGAWVIDSTELTIDEVFSLAADYIQQRFPMSK
ncbi:MAG: (d)CMP kinase [Pseudomonadota bacterium]